MVAPHDPLDLAPVRGADAAVVDRGRQPLGLDQDAGDVAAAGPPDVPTSPSMSSLRPTAVASSKRSPRAGDLQAVVAGVDQAVDPDPLPDVFERPPADDADRAVRPPGEPLQDRPRRRGQPRESRALRDRRRASRRSRGRATGARRTRRSPRLRQAPRAAAGGWASGPPAGKGRAAGASGADPETSSGSIRRSVETIFPAQR